METMCACELCHKKRSCVDKTYARISCGKIFKVCPDCAAQVGYESRMKGYPESYVFNYFLAVGSASLPKALPIYDQLRRNEQRQENRSNGDNDPLIFNPYDEQDSGEGETNEMHS